MRAATIGHVLPAQQLCRPLALCCSRTLSFCTSHGACGLDCRSKSCNMVLHGAFHPELPAHCNIDAAEGNALTGSRQSDAAEGLGQTPSTVAGSNGGASGLASAMAAAAQTPAGTSGRAAAARHAAGTREAPPGARHGGPRVSSHRRGRQVGGHTPILVHSVAGKPSCCRRSLASWHPSCPMRHKWEEPTCDAWAAYHVSSRLPGHRPATGGTRQCTLQVVMCRYCWLAGPLLMSLGVVVG